MAARVEKAEGSAPSRQEIEATFEQEDLRPHSWGNAPAERYDWHAHTYHKVLYCVSGSIVFHTRDGDLELQAGDRMEVEPGTEHAATVGPNGVGCMEAAR